MLWTYEHGGSAAPAAPASITVLPLGDDRLFVDHDDHKSSIQLLVSRSDGQRLLTVEKVWEGQGPRQLLHPAGLQSAGSLYGYSTRFFTAVDPADGEMRFRSRETGRRLPHRHRRSDGRS